MIQQVDLFTNELRPKPDLLDLRQTLISLGLVFAVLVLVAGAKGWELAELSSEAESLQNELSSVVSGPGSIDVQAELEARIVQLKGERAVLAEQAQTLGGAQRNEGFSREVLMLSKSAIAGLWLTEFSLTRSHQGDPVVSLAGQTHNPRFVGRYVEAIKEHGGLSGYSFADIEIARVEDESMFRLNGSLREVDGSLD